MPVKNRRIPLLHPGAPCRGARNGIVTLAAAVLLLALGTSSTRAESVGRRLQLHADARPPAGLVQLSSQIAEMQRVMRSRFKIDTVYIVGGSARSVLDATYGFKPLEMRDLDLFAVTNTRDRTTHSRTRRLASELAKLGYRKHPVEDRLRGDPTLGAKGINHNAGYGFFLNRPGDSKIVDVSLLHSEAAFQLNGPLNIDRIRIPIRHDQSLLDVWRAMRGKSYRTAVRAGVVLDRDNGYVGWRTGRLKLVNPGDVWADVERMKPRLVKSYLKAGARMPRRLVKQLRSMPQRRGRQPDLELRYAQRVIDLPLPAAAEGLALLRRLRAPALQDPRLQETPRYREVARSVSSARAARVQGKAGRRWPAAGKRPPARSGLSVPRVRRARVAASR